MISLVLDSEDINSLVPAVNVFAKQGFLNDLCDFRLTDDGFLDFDYICLRGRRFLGIGTPSLKIPFRLRIGDSDGKLLVSVPDGRLADLVSQLLKLAKAFPRVDRYIRNHFFIEAESGAAVSFCFRDLAEQMLKDLPETEEDGSAERARRLWSFLSRARFRDVSIRDRQLRMSLSLD